MNHPLGNPNNNFSKPTLIIGNKNYSSWSLRAWLMLDAFGVAFDEMPIKLFHPSNQEILTKYTPLGKVPVLLHEDKTIWDTIGIALYAEKYLIKQNVWGNQPHLAMSLIAEMHSGFVALRNEMPMNIRAKRKITPSQDCLKDLTRFEAIVSEGFGLNGETGFLLGEFSVADVFFAPVIFRLHTYATASNIELKPTTQAYIQAMLAHPSIQLWQQQALQETDIVVEDEAGEYVGNLAY
ncbi:MULTISPECIES: glutathione S-transferase family protein [unclassified Moraxella]|uniref:glutathione S-transferase family protein n=1 Tax=unclassified Moraxella TaxID=2685852 RepID=UPI003AF8992F